MLERGYLTLFRARGVPFRAHWSLPLGVFVWSGLRVAPGIWLGVLTLIVVHEIGHAVLVRRYGLSVLGIDVTGFGGRCRWMGRPKPRERAAIAWGGVLAQLPILALALLVSLGLSLAHVPVPRFVAELLEAFTYVNALLIVINLIPFPPLDGAEAWPWFRLWREDRRRQRKWKDKLTREPPAANDELNQTLREALEEADRRAR